jgi:hypothetical protein
VKESPSSSAETAVNQVKTSHNKDSSSQPNNAEFFVPVPGDYPDSDGGVELPKDSVTTNGHGIGFSVVRSTVNQRMAPPTAPIPVPRLSTSSEKEWVSSHQLWSVVDRIEDPTQEPRAEHRKS